MPVTEPLTGPGQWSLSGVATVNVIMIRFVVQLDHCSPWLSLEGAPLARCFEPVGEEYPKFMK